MKYGVFDVKDKCWIGDDKGPRLFDDMLLARVAAEMVDVQLKTIMGRHRAKPYLVEANKLRDEVQVQVSSERALELLEGGYIC